jgi:hypothetical protein
VRDFVHDGGASLQNSSPGLESFSRKDTLASADQDAETFIYRHTLSSSKLQLEKNRKACSSQCVIEHEIVMLAALRTSFVHILEEALRIRVAPTTYITNVMYSCGGQTNRCRKQVRRETHR